MAALDDSESAAERLTYFASKLPHFERSILEFLVRRRDSRVFSTYQRFKEGGVDFLELKRELLTAVVETSGAIVI